MLALFFYTTGTDSIAGMARHGAVMFLQTYASEIYEMEKFTLNVSSFLGSAHSLIPPTSMLFVTV